MAIIKEYKVIKSSTFYKELKEGKTLFADDFYNQVSLTIEGTNKNQFEDVNFLIEAGFIEFLCDLPKKKKGIERLNFNSVVSIDDNDEFSLLPSGIVSKINEIIDKLNEL